MHYFVTNETITTRRGLEIIREMPDNIYPCYVQLDKVKPFSVADGNIFLLQRNDNTKITQIFPIRDA